MLNPNLFKLPGKVLQLVAIAVVLTILVPITTPLLGIVLTGVGIMLFIRKEPDTRTSAIITTSAGSIFILVTILFFLTQIKAG